MPARLVVAGGVARLKAKGDYSVSSASGSSVSSASVSSAASFFDGEVFGIGSFGPRQATCLKAASKSGGSFFPRRPARDRIPVAALWLK